MPEKQKVLIVDDDPMITRLVTQLLEREQFVALTANSREAMHKVLASDSMDLILLDVGLPDANGFDLLKGLRTSSTIPIIMMTGQDSPVDRILGLEFGADDYVCKPFEPRELVARVKSVLRRSELTRPDDENTQSNASINTHSDGDECIRFSSFVLNLTKRSLSHATGEEITLTSGEFDLLKVLTQSAEQPMSRDQILEATRSRDWDPFDRSIDVLIGRLRKKLEQDSKQPRLIKTVRGIGYVLAATATPTTQSIA